MEKLRSVIPLKMEDTPHSLYEKGDHHSLPVQKYGLQLAVHACQPGNPYHIK